MAQACTGECLRQLDNGDYTEVGENCPNPTPCTPQNCVNFPMCGSTGPLWLLQCKGGRCVQPCDMMYGRSFQFFAPEDKEKCPVCLQHADTYMKYPCEHVICPACFCPRSLVYPEQPNAYGFGLNVSDDILDINGEDSPEYFEAFESWKVLRPDQYAEWQAALSTWEINQQRGDWRKQMELMKNCPLCRRGGVPLGTDAHWNKAGCRYQPPGV